MWINVPYDLSDKCLDKHDHIFHRVISPPKIEERRSCKSEQIPNTTLSIQINWLLQIIDKRILVSFPRANTVDSLCFSSLHIGNIGPHFQVRYLV